MSTSIDKAIRKAQKHFKAGEVSLSKQVYEDILRKFPKNKKAIQGYKKLKANLEFGSVTALEPDPQKIKEVIRNYESCQYEKVVSLAMKLSKSFPKSFKLAIVLAESYKKLGEFANSVQKYRHALQLQPNSEGTWFNLGILLQNQDDADGALDCYKTVLRLNPKNAEAHNNLGGIASANDEEESAIESYKNALKIRPNYFDAHYNLGLVFHKVGNTEDSIKSFRHALAFHPDDAEFYLRMGNVLSESEKYNEAIEIFQKGLSLDPHNADTFNNLSVAFMGIGEIEAAIKSCHRAIEIKPFFSQAYNNLGNAYRKKGEWSEAIEKYKKSISIDPSYAEPYNNLGLIYQQDNFDRAIKHFGQAMMLQPKNTNILHNMAVALKDNGDTEGALSKFKTILEFEPNNAVADHFIAALTGQTTGTAPRAYVEDLFDEYASNFDHSLVNELEYKTPKIISKIAQNICSNNCLGAVLDLGCGTGLVGMEITKFCETLQGVDLSKSMLAEAKKKNIYNSLYHRDIEEYLASQQLDFDFIISADVFVYMGDLSEVFCLIKNRNKRPSKLIFSTEHGEGYGFKLERSGRYSHSQKYIEGLCKKFNCELVHFETSELRRNKGVSLNGGFYSVEF